MKEIDQMTDDTYEIPSTTPNFQTELAAQLAELIPEAIADGKVDLEKLRELLGSDTADSSERFGMFWPGKKRALRAAQEPSTATLRPDFGNSKDWNTTKNIFIEGENLEVLKILQKHYHAKIKQIYIDPPYNTGKEFVYPDNFKEGLDTYLDWTRQVNEEGRRISTNAETEGRYHSNWLNMMYPRLKLARNLLADDGVIFVSIDDHEVHNLRALMNEVFGEAQFVASIVWQKRYSRENRGAIGDAHEYLLVYARNPARFQEVRGLIPPTDKQTQVYKNLNNDPRGRWRPVPMTAQGYRANQMYEVVTPTGVSHRPPEGRCWGLVEPEYKKLLAAGRIYFGKDGNAQPNIIRYLDEVKGFVPWTWWPADEAGHTDESRKEIQRIFGTQTAFDTPKPVRLLERVLQIGLRPDDTVLDFFAGSGTIGEAVMRLNHADGGSRKYIQVQLPEPVPDVKELKALEITTIAGLARHRMSVTGELLKARDEEKATDGSGRLDIGFRSYNLIDTNFAKWRITSDIEANALEQHLLTLRDSSDDDANPDDLLTEILLKQGYSLTERIVPVKIAGLDVRSVVQPEGDVAVLAYLDEHVKPSLGQLRAMVDAGPQRIIVLEDAFHGDDELKTNLAQLAKSKGVEIWTV